VTTPVIKRTTVVSMNVVLEVMVEDFLMSMAIHLNARKNHSIRTANKLFENMSGKFQIFMNNCKTEFCPRRN
jgi:hypothetical protein